MNIQSTTYVLSTREYFQLAAFSLLCFFAFTHNLNEIPPYHTDENFYVTSTRNMVVSGDYITPIYHGEKRFAKPILFYWLVAASYKTFGINLFSARLVSAFFGTLCVPIVFIIARRIFDHKTAVISALILPGCYLHFQISRWAITDMALNFFILLTFYFFIRGWQDKSNKGIPYYLAYLCMAIGFMVKGPPAIIIPGIVVLGFILILRDWQLFSQLRIGYGMVVLATIILPWFIAMLVFHGNEFKNHILGAELRDRVIHDIPFSLYYFGVTIRYHLPWSLFFIATLAIRFGLVSITPDKNLPKASYFSSLLKALKDQWGKITKKDNLSFLFTLLWIAGPLLLFTLFRIEHSRYMLPASPAIAMITAHFFSQLLDSPDGFEHRAFKIPFYLTLILYILIIFLTGFGIFFLRTISSAPYELVAFLVLIFLSLILLLQLYRLKKYFVMILTISIIQITVLASSSGNTFSFFNQYPMKKFANQILVDAKTNKRIGLYRLGNHRARMGIITGLPSIYLNNPEELKKFLEPGGNIYVVMRESEWQQKFFDSPMTLQSKDTGWKKSKINPDKIQLLLKDGLKPHLSKFFESYVLLKTEKLTTEQTEASQMKNHK